MSSEGAKKLCDLLCIPAGTNFDNDGKIDAAVARLVAALEHAQKHHCQCSYEGTCIYCKALEQWRTGR